MFQLVGNSGLSMTLSKCPQANEKKGPRASSFFNFAGSNFELLDMDISDSDLESEKADEEADEDWVASDLETDLESGRLVKKKSSRTRASGVVAPHQTNSEDVKPEAVIEETVCNNAKPASNVCCSCSRRSLCKTDRCECRSTGGTCGESCSCAPTKCMNRDVGSGKTDMDESLKSEMSVGVGSSTNTDDNEKDKVLASQGAMLLQNALAEELSNVKNEGNGTGRRPLSDIGNNSQIKSNAPRPNQRKKWKKSEFKVKVVPPPTQSENVEEPLNPENNMVENDMPLKLPRSMRSTTLKKRNSKNADDMAGGRVEGVASPKSPSRQTTALEDKENNGI